MRKKTKIGDVLQKNSAYKTVDAKIYIIKNGIMEYKCFGCGNTGEWRGKRLTLELHHKDGDRRNHSKENLEFRCPNCHSITDTDGRLKKTVIDEEKLKPLLSSGKNYAEICNELQIPLDGSSFYKLKTAIRRHSSIVEQ